MNDEAKSKSKTKFKMSPHRLEQQSGGVASEGGSIAISKKGQNKRGDFLGALRL